MQKMKNRARAGISIIISFLIIIAAQGLLFSQDDSGIYGVVRSQNQNSETDSPVPEAVITALDSAGEMVARTIATRAGSYRLLVAPGQYRLKAENQDYLGFDTREVIIQVQKGHFTLFNIGMTQSVKRVISGLRGLVYSGGNLPLEGARVQISDQAGREIAAAVTSSSGEYEISLAAGRYSVTVVHEDYPPLGPKDVEVGSEGFVELILSIKGSLKPKGGIQGLIRARAEGGAAGKPVNGAVVSARQNDSGQTFTATSNNIGYYKFSLESGSYRLSVAHPDYETADNGAAPLTVEAESMATWNALLTSKTPAGSVKTCRERYPVALGSSYGEKHSIFLRIESVGVLTVSYRWTGTANQIALLVTGPDGKSRRVDGRAPLSITTEVNTEHHAAGSQWEVTVINFGGGSAAGTISVSYPCQE